MKQYAIGLISGALLSISAMMFIGATNQNKNLGDITVNSIRVVNHDGEVVGRFGADESGGWLAIYNNDSKIAALLLAGENGGWLAFFNNDGKAVGGFGADESADERGGWLAIYNNDGKTVAGLSAGEDGGSLNIYNKHEKKVATLQSNKNLDGAIYLFDRYGEIGWAKTGKQQVWLK